MYKIGFNTWKSIFYNKYQCLIRSKTDKIFFIESEDVNNNVKRIILNNPKRRNSLSINFMTQLESKLIDIENQVKSREVDIKAVIIKSSSFTFSSGHDLLEFDKTNSEDHIKIFDKASEVSVLNNFHKFIDFKLMKVIENYFIPIIVSVQGPAAAAGCQLVASCDIAVCGKSSTFSTPGILAGLFCSTPGVAIGRVLPRKIALEMTLTGEPISAEAALRFGLVNHVVDDCDVDKVSEKIANKIASLSSPVISLGKKCFNEQMMLQKENAYEHASSVMVKNLQIADCKEGIKAFLEKRKPKWNQ